jgi:fructoselysine-6-P-deglycase FrlB-like protein
MDDHRLDPNALLPRAPDPWAGSEMPTLRDGPPWHMTEMIEAEPALAGRILRGLAEPDSGAARLADAIRQAAERGRRIVVTGCGTSEHAALGVAEILRDAMEATNLPYRPGTGGAPQAVQAFEALHLGAGLVIGVSHEGGTWATNLAMERAKAEGAKIALITCSDRSPGAALAHIVVQTWEPGPRGQDRPR